MFSDRPSVLMILLDALRADCAPGAAPSPHLRSLGLRPPRLPALERLVRGWRCFTQALSCSAYTTACVGSIFTGLLPPEHGVRAFDLASLSPDVLTLAEILVSAGYATCAMSDQPPVLQPMGLLRGFQTIVADEHEALTWWDSYESVPRFLFLHLWDAHKPYGMPFGRAYRSQYPVIVRAWQERLRAKGIPEPQTTELLDADAQRQRVYEMQFAWEAALGFKAGLENYLDGLQTFDHGRLHNLVAAFTAHNVLAESIGIVLADHGEGHDCPPSQRMTHDRSLADDIMRIPLYVRLLGDTSSRKITAQVSQADVTPTLLDALGLLAARTPPRSAYNGRSLLPLMREESLPERAAYAEVFRLNNDPKQPVAAGGERRQATVHARVLRYPTRKYRLAGQPLMPDDPLTLSDHDVVRRVCRDLLGRIERDDDFAAWSPILAEAQGTVQARRRTLLRHIQSSDEYRLLNKYAIYDLQHDPLEEKPIDPYRNRAYTAEYEAQVAIMQEIDRCARPGGPLLTNEADEQVILKRLQNLGYIE